MRVETPCPLKPGVNLTRCDWMLGGTIDFRHLKFARVHHIPVHTLCSRPGRERCGTCGNLFTGGGGFAVLLFLSALPVGVRAPPLMKYCRLTCSTVTKDPCFLDLMTRPYRFFTGKWCRLCLSVPPFSLRVHQC